MYNEILLIKYHNPNLKKIELLKNGDWVDLRSAQYIEMEKGDFRLISLGISIQLPEGYEAHIAPRSSTFKNFGIIQANGLGIVDFSYRGDNDVWMFPAYAVRDTTILENDRICQFRIMKKQPEIIFLEVEKFNAEDRGGIGSTGIK